MPRPSVARWKWPSKPPLWPTKATPPSTPRCASRAYSMCSVMPSTLFVTPRQFGPTTVSGTWRPPWDPAHPPGRSCRVLVGLEHHEVRAVLERMPVRLDLHADLQLLDRAVDDVGDEVDTDVEGHTDHCVGLG